MISLRLLDSNGTANAHRPSAIGSAMVPKPAPGRPRDDVGIFRAVVELQDQGLPVSDSYRIVAARRRLTVPQVRAIVDLGVRLGWVDEHCGLT